MVILAIYYLLNVKERKIVRVIINRVVCAYASETNGDTELNETILRGHDYTDIYCIHTPIAQVFLFFYRTYNVPVM